VRGPLIAALALISGTLTASARQAAAPTLADLLSQGAAYVEAFEAQFALAVSDEDYEQVVTRWVGSRASTELVQRRVTQSEMVFVWLPHEQLWLATRNVRSIDGEPVVGSDGALSAAMAPTADERARRLRRLRNEGARINIGPIGRNFSDPTLPLQFLAAPLQPRFAWTLTHEETLAGVATWRIDYEERSSPTLIKRGTLDMPAQGSVWIQAGTGAVVRTTLRLDDRDVRTHVDMDVLFKNEPKLEVWAPSRMSETYTRAGAPRSAISREDRVVCTARYSNYRRFDTAVRVLPATP